MSINKLNIPDKYYKKSHLIIIGISKYDKEDDLPNAFRDASGMEKILVSEKYQFTNLLPPLYNKDATLATLREIFMGVITKTENVGDEDRLVIYFAGHGDLRTQITRGGVEQKQGFLIPYDAEIEKHSTFLEMDIIVNSLQTCHAKHILLILDCCHSGYIGRGVKHSNKYGKNTMANLKYITERKGIQVLAASEEDQKINDSGKTIGYSAFTRALLDIFEDEVDFDDNGLLTANEIGSHIDAEVQKQTSSNGRFQKPVFRELPGHEGGDLVFKIFAKSPSTGLETTKQKIENEFFSEEEQQNLLELLQEEKIMEFNELRATKDSAEISFSRADLSGVNLEKANLSKVNLNHADLSGAFLAESDLSEANLYKANLADAEFMWTLLDYADLTFANLTGAWLTDADLNNADLSGANLSKANLSSANLNRADLTGANLTEATLTKTDLTEANLSEANLCKANLTNADLTKANLSVANLTKANLNNACLANTVLSEANLTDADLTDADLTDADLAGANLTNTDLNNVD